MKLIRLISALVLVSCLQLQAVTLYFSSTGNSANSGTRISPYDWSTASKFGSNNNVLVGLSGQYKGGFTASGMSNCTVIADVKYQTVFQDAVSANLDISSSFNVIFSGLTFSNSTASFGIHAGTGNSNITLDHDYAVSNFLSGFIIGGGGTSNEVAQFCLAHGNGLQGNNQNHGFYIEGISNIIRCCVSRYDSGGWGFQFFSGFTNSPITWTDFYNCLTYGNFREGAVIYGCDGTISNNGTNGFGGQLGTNFVHNNTFLDGLHPEYGQLILTNNIILPNAAKGDTIAITNGPAGAQATVWAGANLGTNAEAGITTVTTYTALAFKSPSTGLYWLGASSTARSAAITTWIPAIDFFGNVQSSIADVGAFQYNPVYALDLRVLDPTPPSGPGYWSSPVSGAQMIIRLAQGQFYQSTNATVTILQQ